MHLGLPEPWRVSNIVMVPTEKTPGKIEVEDAAKSCCPSKTSYRQHIFLCEFFDININKISVLYRKSATYNL